MSMLEAHDEVIRIPNDDDVTLSPECVLLGHVPLGPIPSPIEETESLGRPEIAPKAVSEN
jgi:hypothetical protein